MHITFSLIIIVAIIKALGFAAEAYSQYEIPLLIFTGLYFGFWLLTKLLVSIPGMLSTTSKSACAEQIGESGPLYAVGTASFCLVLLIYASMVVAAIALVLLINGHSTSAFVIGLLSIIPLALLAACADAQKGTKDREKMLANPPPLPVPKCPFCGKDLPVLREKRCPHCGSRLA